MRMIAAFGNLSFSMGVIMVTVIVTVSMFVSARFVHVGMRVFLP